MSSSLLAPPLSAGRTCTFEARPLTLLLKNASSSFGAPARNLNHFFRVSEDILLDGILTLLTVEDILTLRRVCKWLNALTRHPIVWKRIAQTLNSPLASVPPCANHNLLKLISGPAIERMVTRAISFDNNWRSAQPKAFGVGTFFTHGHDVMDMVVLPGGKHLVLTAMDRRTSSSAIYLYSTDQESGFMPLAGHAVPSQPFHLTAKYTSGDDVCDERPTGSAIPGVFIAYVLHEFASTSTFEGTPTASVYQCQCYFVGIKPFERTLNTAGEILHDAYMRARSDQFEILADISSATELGPIELGAFGACKTLAVVQSPQSIIFQDLCPGGEHRVVTIANFSEYSPRLPTIKALRLLSDGTAIVVGTMPQKYQGIASESSFECSKKILFVGAYNVLNHGGGETAKLDVINKSEVIFYGADCGIEDITLSDVYSSRPAFQRKASQSASLQSMGIFLRHPEKEQIIEMRVLPRATSNQSDYASMGSYDVHTIKQAWVHSVIPKGRIGLGARVGVLPGSKRALLLTTFLEADAGNRILLNLQSHIPPSELENIPATPNSAATAFTVKATESDHQLECDSRRRTIASRSTSLSNILVPRNIRNILQGHLQATSWDDCNGRLFVAIRGSCRVHMIELGAIPRIK